MLRRIKIFLVNGIILTISSLLMHTIGMAFSIYISNKIGSEALGVFQLIMSVYMFFITLATSGINLASTRIVSEELAINNVQGAKKAIKQCVLFSLLVGSSAGIILFSLSPYIATYWLHGKVSHIIFYILSIALPFMSVSSAINGYFSALRKVIKTASSQVLEQIIKIFLVIFLFSIFLPNNIEYACLSLVLGSTVSEIISCIFAFLLYYFEQRKLEYNYRKKFDYKKRIFRISIPVSITSYVRSGLSTLKQILIPLQLEKSGLPCDTALSKYGIITGMVMPILMFPSTILYTFSGLLIPEFSDYNQKKKYREMNAVITRIFKLIFIFSIFIIGIFWTFSKPLSLLIYNNLEVAHYLKILAPVAVFIYVDNIIDNLLKGLDKQVGVMLVNVLDLFVSIGFILLLLPINGIYAYLTVIYISELLNFFASLYILRKTILFKIDYYNWIIKPIIGIAFSFFVVYFCNINKKSPLVTLFLEMLIFTVFYFIFLVSSSCIEKKDFRL